MTLVQTELNKCYIGSIQIKKIYKGNLKIRPASILPSQYQEVEYIESNGSGNSGPYIIPGISIESGISMGIEADFEWNNTTGRAEVDLYSIYNSSNGYIQNGFWENPLGFHCNFVGCTNTSYSFTPNTVAKNTRYYYEANRTPGWSNARGCYLLAQQESNNSYWRMSAKLYSVKLYKNNQLVRDFVPCYRKSDTVIGLYDLIEGVFYTNAGDGSFTKGPNV